MRSIVARSARTAWRSAGGIASRWAIAAAVGLANLGPAAAQSYPHKPIRVVQGFAVGGNADAIARAVANEMSRSLRQPIVVDAVVGAGGTVAASTVARAPADGYTLLLATGGHAVAGAMMEKLPYDTVRSFQMVSTVTYFPFLFVVNANSNLRDFNDLVVASRQANGLNYGTAGVGTTHHLAGELLASMGKLKLQHVPYKGDAASTAAVLGQQIDFIIAPATAVESNIRSGKLRALAVSGKSRWLGMPEVPTVAEQGIAGYDVRSWAGWMLPAGASPMVVRRLNEAVREALLSNAVRSQLRQMGGEAQASSPDEMTVLVQQELSKWRQVVDDARIPRN